ncbi:unnamed protein product [Phytomonas sp. EM1]|nr:unnamed protein product [Phytomonas sp. EM1]|eukprot:CCW62071.1 unnamed protein product [Phytomonas sp. isolate EM1]
MEDTSVNATSSTQAEISIELLSLPPPPSITPLLSPQELQARYDLCVAQSRKRMHDEITTSEGTCEKPGGPVSSSIDDVFLSCCPTLQLQPTEVVPLVQEFLLQWFSEGEVRSKFKKELEGINASYLQSLYDAPERKEADLFGRVDVDRSRRILISNSEAQTDSAGDGAVDVKRTREKRIAECVSCLTQGQHRHYRNVLKHYTRDRRRPPASTPSHPDTTVILDLIQAEQACFLSKLRRETCECVRCVEEDVGGILSSGNVDNPHDCINHNFFGGSHLRRFAQYRRMQLLSERVEGFLILAKIAACVEGSSDPSSNVLSAVDKKVPTGRDVYFHSYESFSCYGRLAPAGLSVQVQLVDSKDWSRMMHAEASKKLLPPTYPGGGAVESGKSISQSEHYKAGEVENANNATALPFALDVSLLGEVVSAAQHAGEDGSDSGCFQPEILGDSESSNQFGKESASEAYWNDMVDGRYAIHNCILNPMVVALDSTSPAVNTQGLLSRIKGFSLALSFEAMLTLLTAHIGEKKGGGESFHNSFRIPLLVRVVSQAAKGYPAEAPLVDASSSVSLRDDESLEIRLEMGNPFPREKESRRNILADTMEYLINHTKPFCPPLEGVGKGNAEGKNRSTEAASAHSSGGIAESPQTSSHAQHSHQVPFCATLKLFRTDENTASSLLEDIRVLSGTSLFSKPLYLNVMHHAAALQDGVRPIFTMVKVDYLTKSPSLRSASSSPFSVQSPPPLLRESFSTAEILKVCLLFRCFPTAVVRVYYVNAYFSYIFSIIDFTRSTWEAALTMSPEGDYPSAFENDFYSTPSATQTEDFRYAFDSLYDLLHAVSHCVLGELMKTLHQRPPQTPLRGTTNFHYLLTKLNKSKKTLTKEATVDQHGKKAAHSLQHGDAARQKRRYGFRLYHTHELYPKFSLPFNKRKDAEELTFVEGVSSEVCEREYLPPDNWIYRDRIPFTFPPAKVS